MATGDHEREVGRGAEFEVEYCGPTEKDMDKAGFK
jgi:hypothetical protein